MAHAGRPGGVSVYPQAWYYRSVFVSSSPPECMHARVNSSGLFLFTSWLAESSRAWGISNTRWKIDKQWDWHKPYGRKKSWRPDPGYGRGVPFWAFFFSGQGSLARVTPLFLCGFTYSSCFTLAIFFFAMQRWSKLRRNKRVNHLHLWGTETLVRVAQAHHWKWGYPP